MVTSAPKPPASARVGSTTDPAGSPAPTAPAPTSVGPGHEWSIPAVATPDQAAAAAARALHDELAKPPGSLGRLEDLAVQLAAISGICPPPVPDRPAVAVFAGDHGVVAAGVTPWPSEVTASMLTTVATGGAAVNALAQVAGASVTAVAVGVATPWVPSSRILDRTVRAGTDDLAEGPAMSVVEARRALAVGAQVAQELIAGGANALVTGDLGIGNTTPSAALVAAFTGCSAAEATGRGTSTDDSTLARKVAVVARAVDRLRGQLSVADGAPIENDDEAATTALAGVGGLEHAALTGFIIGGAAARVPVVIDGLAAGAAALVAHAMAPWVVPYLIAGHRSVEPGASGALAHLGLDPIIDLDLRLGEGTGALLAVPVVQSAAVVMHRMATLREVGAVPDDERGI